MQQGGYLEKKKTRRREEKKGNTGEPLANEMAHEQKSSYCERKTLEQTRKREKRGESQLEPFRERKTSDRSGRDSTGAGQATLVEDLEQYYFRTLWRERAARVY